ncbi:MAG TPA: O-antigen ligase family protein [Gaiellaceae bacterium]|nr:O-antigen ligase family protein [Gaiellaceae bacterium]
MSSLAGEYRRAPAGRPSRAPVVACLFLIGAALILVAVAVVAGSGLQLAAAPLGLLVLVAASHQRVLAWRSLLALTILVILFIPIKRYTLPSALPFNLEIYRLIVFAVFLAWLTSLLIDERVRLRRSGLEAPLVAYLVVILASLLVNTKRVNAVGPDVIKSVTFFLSFVIVFWILVSLARRARDIDFLVRVLAGGGAVLALTAVIESRTNYNVFNHLRSVLPFLHYEQSLAPNVDRGGRLRVYASAQHPIALSAAMAMLLPLALYRAQASRQRLWWAAVALILFGVLAARSRTGIVMLLAIGIVYLVLRPKQLKRLWPALIPALVAVHIVLPGALGTIQASFFPKGGIIAEQNNASAGHARLATLGPALRNEFAPNPILGEGFATRVPQPDEYVPVPNAPITDDQWLVVLLETGVVGMAAFLWLFLRALRRMGKAAKRDPSPRGTLLVATTASVAAYGVSMFTYDAFSFIQSTFLFFIVLGVGAAALHSRPEEWEGLRRPAQRVVARGALAAASARGR